MSKHSHYHKDVSRLQTIDVYAVCQLFAVEDPSGATQHAIKKLLCPGQRGAKSLRQDLQEAVDTLLRRIAMIDDAAGWTQKAIDAASFVPAELHAAGLGPRDVLGNQMPIEPAAAIDDDSPRAMAIGQYAALTGQHATDCPGCGASINSWHRIDCPNRMVAG